MRGAKADAWNWGAARRTDRQGAREAERRLVCPCGSFPWVVGRSVVVGRRGTCMIDVTKQLRAAGEVTERSKVHAC
jgi:hypothetical protein